MNFKTLISDDKKNVSIGRVTMWLFTFVILYKIIFDNGVDNNTVYIYTLLVGYNLFKKPINVWEKINKNTGGRK